MGNGRVNPNLKRVKHKREKKFLKPLPFTIRNKLSLLSYMKLFEKLIQRKEAGNMFWAPTETLVQGINDANKMGQAFFWTVSCV